MVYEKEKIQIIKMSCGDEIEIYRPHDLMIVHDGGTINTHYNRAQSDQSSSAAEIDLL